MQRVIYLRHGQASIFSENYDQLSDLGVKQSLEVGKYLASREIPVSKIYVGPLRRHHQTLQGILQVHPALKDISIEETRGLKEHQGYSALKHLLPQLVVEDLHIRTLVNHSFETRDEQIKHHIRIYNHFAYRWARGEFDDRLPKESQSWKVFKEVAEASFDHIWKSSKQENVILVITSSGPTAVAVGSSQGFKTDETIKLATELFNASITSLTQNGSGIGIYELNAISHLSDPTYHTLV